MRFAVSLGIVLLLWACAENRAPQQPQQQQTEGSLPPPDVPYGPDASGFYAPTTPSLDMLRRDSLEAQTAARQALMDSLRARFHYVPPLYWPVKASGFRSHNLATVGSRWQEMESASERDNPRLREAFLLVWHPFALEDQRTSADLASLLPYAQLVGQPWRMEATVFPDADAYPDSVYRLHFTDSTVLQFRRWRVERQDDAGNRTVDLPGRLAFVSARIYTPRLPIRGGLRVGSHRREVMQQLRHQVYPVLEFDNLIQISDFQTMSVLTFLLRADTVYCIRSSVYQG